MWQGLFWIYFGNPPFFHFGTSYIYFFDHTYSILLQVCGIHVSLQVFLWIKEYGALSIHQWLVCNVLCPFSSKCRWILCDPTINGSLVYKVDFQNFYFIHMASKNIETNFPSLPIDLLIRLFKTVINPSPPRMKTKQVSLLNCVTLLNVLLDNLGWPRIIYIKPL